MPRYYTGLLAKDYYIFEPMPYHGNGWKVGLYHTRQAEKRQGRRAAKAARTADIR